MMPSFFTSNCVFSLILVQIVTSTYDVSLLTSDGSNSGSDDKIYISFKSDLGLYSNPIEFSDFFLEPDTWYNLNTLSSWNSLPNIGVIEYLQVKYTDIQIQNFYTFPHVFVHSSYILVSMV